MATRKQKLIKSGLQLRLVGVFLSIACLAALFQVVLLNRSLLSASTAMPTGGDELMRVLPELLGRNLVFTLLVLIPLMVAVGVLVTHRIAGPLHNIEEHLRLIAAGEKPGPCRIRKGDELHELCDLVNRATEALDRSAAKDPTEREREALDRAA